MRAQPFGDGAGEGLAIHRQRTPGGQRMGVGGGHDQPARRAHFPVQQPHRILLVIVGAERVRAYHFGQIAGLVREGADLGAHFVDLHADTAFGRLPGGLGAGHAAADDVECLAHAPVLGPSDARDKAAHSAAWNAAGSCPSKRPRPAARS